MAEKNYSGKFVIRIGPGTHKKLANLARSEGISLNETVKCVLDAGFKNFQRKSNKNLVA